MARHTILILEAKDGGVDFRPEIPKVKRGTPLEVSKGDLVCWVNQTDLDVTLESISPLGVFTGKSKIRAGDATWFLEVAIGIKYRCKKPEQDHEIKIK